ncbi:MAG: M48 family metallopeptidase [Candidatus Paracaedibacteraceae bacterium]|nr:M48 family metallopeptidase [Candidatus Paracaedibacteraceae bacterium]
MFLLKLLKKTNKKFACVTELTHVCPSLKTKDRNIPITFRTHKNAKNLRLRLSKDFTEVIITLPPKTPINVVTDFLSRCELWAASLSLPLPKKVFFEEGAKIPVLGKVRVLHFKNDLKVNFVLEQDKLLVHEKLRHDIGAIKLFLKQLAYEYLSKKTHEYSNILNVRCRSITLKNYISRWGSCSSKGDLTYSWRLVFAPLYVVDYLCAHEVAHLKEMNHSPNFWSCVSLLIPDYKLCRSWLKAHGSTLFLYGPDE